MLTLVVVKGCPALNLSKGEKITAEQKEHTGSGVYRFQITQNGKTRSLYACQFNRNEFNFNNGNPCKKVRVRRTGDCVLQEPNSFQVNVRTIHMF